MKRLMFLSAMSSLVFLNVNCDAPIDNLQTVTPISSISAYQDVRWKDLSQIESLMDSTLIRTLWFNEKTVWPEKFKPYSTSLISTGKNPGLGIRSLHLQGITGKGVSVAIIDQNICLDNIEFSKQIVEYHDVGCNQASSSMHGPAVASLLAGKEIGTAPDANVYFVAAPSWTQDAQYQADALNWIINKNSSLPSGQKIKVVSISAAPSGPGSPFIKNNAAWDSAYSKATKEGILILDCTSNRGIISPCYYSSEHPEDVSKCTLGYPDIAFNGDTNHIAVPNSFRTQSEGNISFQYTGRGGISWAIPYAAGVLALGWQVNPDLSGETMVKLLRKSAYSLKSGKTPIINPVAFIDSIKNINN